MSALNYPQLPQPTHKIRFAAASLTGRYRKANEDALVTDGLALVADSPTISGFRQIDATHPILFGVVDGMGGHAGGSQAASLVASELARWKPDRVLRSGVTTALEEISDRVGTAGRVWGMPEMGTTMALLILSTDSVFTANIGDCRSYQLVDGYLGQLSVDDHLVDGPSNVVTQSLGGDPRALDAHEYRSAHPQGTSRYLLCSDGLHGCLDEGVIKQTLLEAADPSSAVSRLTELAEQASRDNISALVLDVARAD